MNDYRNRPPVDAPRAHPARVALSAPVTVMAAAALFWIGIGIGGYLVCLVAGLVFR